MYEPKYRGQNLPTTLIYSYLNGIWVLCWSCLLIEEESQWAHNSSINKKYMDTTRDITEDKNQAD